ncbi:MAG: class I fructose-bisphosphate aldolase, partial [Hyphomicrobiaceae bacterium]
THDLDTCDKVTRWVLNTVFDELYDAGIKLEGMVLKPHMVVAGQKCARQPSVGEVAEKTIACLKATVPASVAGIAFLSGGQSDELATEHLSAMNGLGNLPWPVTFSYGRALQAAALKAWGGKSENVAAGQRAFSHRARMNGMAAMGKWQRSLEKAA